MSVAAGRVAGKVGAIASKAAETGGKQQTLKKEAKRNPELYVGHQDLARCSPISLR